MELQVSLAEKNAQLAMRERGGPWSGEGGQLLLAAAAGEIPALLRGVGKFLGSLGGSRELETLRERVELERELLELDERRAALTAYASASATSDDAAGNGAGSSELNHDGGGTGKPG